MKRTTSTGLPKFLCVLIISMHSLLSGSFGQILGLEPPSARWKMIDTPHAQIIFESKTEAKAQRVANLVNLLAQRDSSYIGGAAQKVPIILHSRSTLPAGVPNLAPWRSDWSLTAPQDPFMGAILWVDGLTIHEYRHHQQMTRAKHGWFSHILRAGLGQVGWFLGVLTIQPNWFFEGDATYTETVLTSGGRGRMPQFDREYRTIRVSGMDYNYEKASRYSRKDFVPNIYREGYYLTSFARRHWGTDIWTRVLNDTYRKKGIFYPFSRSLKKYTGLRTKDLYQAAMIELDSIWHEQDRSLTLTKSDLVSSAYKKMYTDYKYPFYTPDGQVLVEKSSFQQLRTYYLIDNAGNERRLFQPGNVTPDHENLSLTGNLLSWAENRFHPRWEMQDYSVIFLYNLKTGLIKQLTKKSRYYSPAVSYDGNTIIALKLMDDASQRLVLLHEGTGKEITYLPNPQKGQYAYPRFTRDDKYVITGYTDYQGNTLQLIDAETGKAKNLLPFSDQVATRPFDLGDFVIFSGTYTGINNIFAVSKSSGQIYQITSSRFGAYMPSVSPDGSILLFSEYTATGFEVRKMDLDEDLLVPFDTNTPSRLNYIDPLANAEGGSVVDKVPDRVFPTRKFNATSRGLFKFHSWTPSLDENEYGLEAISNNIMTNTSATLGYRYNIKEKTNVAFGRVSYGALFPVFDLGYSYNIRNSKEIFDNQYRFGKFDWREHQFSGGLRIPLRLSSGTYTTHLEFKTQYDHFSLSKNESAGPISRINSFDALGGAVTFNRIKSRKIRQIKPTWGQDLSLNLKQNLGNDEEAYLLYANATFYFPGLLPTHSLFFTGAYQKEKLTDAYRFENFFPNPRGFQEKYFTDSVHTNFEQMTLGSINYFFPIIYPDLDRGSLFYTHSISANLFYDHSKVELDQTSRNMRSAGIDLSFEMTTLRLFRTSVTLRGLYRLDRPDASMKPFLFDVVFEILDLAF